MSGDLLHAMAAALRALSEATGEPAFCRAERALFQQPAGRPAINDAQAVAEAVDLFERGEARSLSDAFNQVARAKAPYGNRRSVAEWFRRNHARQQKVSTQSF